MEVIVKNTTAEKVYLPIYQPEDAPDELNSFIPASATVDLIADGNASPIEVAQSYTLKQRVEDGTLVIVVNGVQLTAVHSPIALSFIASSLGTIRSPETGEIHFTEQDGVTGANLSAAEYNALTGHLIFRSPTNDFNIFLNSTGDGELTSSAETLQITRGMGTDECRFTSSGGSGSFKFMNDVELTGNSIAPTPTTGDDSTKIATTAFVSASVALENTLEEMNDVDISGLTNENILVYDSTSTKWENKAPATLPVSTDTQTALDLKAPIDSPAFTGQTVTQTAGDTEATTHTITGGFSDLILKTNQGNFDLHQNEGRILWDDAGGGSAGAIKMKQKIGQPMDFYVGGITDKKMSITTDGVEVDAFSDNVVVKKQFPDLELKSDEEKRLLFTDAGGGATAAIKHVSSDLDFYVGGIVGANKEMSVTTSGVDIGTLKIAGTEITASPTQLNYVDLTSSAQTQIDSKQEIIGDGDLTIARTNGLQAALDDKAPIASPSFTGTVGASNITATDKIIAEKFEAEGHLKLYSGGTNDCIWYLTGGAEACQMTLSGSDVRWTATGGSGTFKFNQQTDLAGGMKLSGTAITASAAALNYVDLTSSAQTQLDDKAELAGATFTGNVSVAKNWPDVELKSGDEKRLIFSDAGGSGTGAIKHVSTSLDFYASGIAASNKRFSVNSDGVNVSGVVVCENQAGDPSAVADSSILYAKDDGGSSEMYVLDEAGNSTKISPHNDQNEWEYYSHNIKTGKRFRVNMESMIRQLQEYTGLTFIEDD